MIVGARRASALADTNDLGQRIAGVSDRSNRHLCLRAVGELQWLLRLKQPVFVNGCDRHGHDTLGEERGTAHVYYTTNTPMVHAPPISKISKQRLSEGEKQIFAISVLWGIARASARSLPAIIDTPIARLDARHREHLVERYVPNANHQVIILSTDTEVDRRYYESLEPHPAGAMAGSTVKWSSHFGGGSSNGWSWTTPRCPSGSPGASLNSIVLPCMTPWIAMHPRRFTHIDCPQRS
jgi:hypothetical protein